MNKDQKLIAEAYNKVRESLYSDNSSAGAKGKIDPKEFKAARDKLRDGLNKLAKGMMSSDISDVVYTLTQYPTFSPQAKQLRDELEDELDSIKDDNELRAKWKNISRLGLDLLNATIWSFGESVEESSEKKITLNGLS